MKEKCFDIGIIQAFLDGELAPEKSAQVTNHIADCDACAFALAEAEEETAFAFSALEGEFNTLVPTQRLWSKINDSIAEEKKQTSVWTRFGALISAAFLNPSFSVAAGAFVVFAIFAAVLLMPRADQNAPQTAAFEQNNSTLAPIQNITETKNLPTSNDQNLAAVNVPDSSAAAPKSENRTASRQNDLRKLVINAGDRKAVNTEDKIDLPKTKDQTPKTENLLYIPGEESYVRTIATLKQTVDGQKDTVMKPSARVAFERDLAVVNDSIDKMKQEVRRNPRNDSAKQVLYASYQNKIDLLNSVAERNEFVASLK